MIEISFTDVQFSHNLGFYLAIYNWALWNIPFIAPIASGFIAQNHGWRWIIYTVVIISCACIVLEGDISMKHNDVLDAEDLADGIRLTCQALPLTELLKISYNG